MAEIINTINNPFVAINHIFGFTYLNFYFKSFIFVDIEINAALLAVDY
jgi:hypothetical protein